MKLKFFSKGGLVVLMSLFALSSCKKDDIEIIIKKKSSGQEKGFVYTMSNDAGGNTVLCYKQNDNGSLSYKFATTSGGKGSSEGLGSQGSIVIDAAHKLLYAVNAGSNSISSFKVNKDGSLTLAHTISSNGMLPVSVSVYANWLYVVNSVTSNICGYKIGSGGDLTMIEGSNKPLSAASAGPAQISFNSNGKKLIVTEKMTNKITSYAVNGQGVPGDASSQNSAGQTPFGFDFSGSKYIIVTEAFGGMPNASTVSSYSVSGTTTLTSGPIATGQTAACWTDVTRDGKYAYVTNTQSNNISLFKVSDNGSLHLLDASEAETGLRPIDIVLSGDEHYIYNLNAGSNSIGQYKREYNEELKKIGEVTGLPAYAVGLVAF